MLQVLFLNACELCWKKEPRVLRAGTTRRHILLRGEGGAFCTSCLPVMVAVVFSPHSAVCSLWCSCCTITLWVLVLSQIWSCPLNFFSQQHHYGNLSSVGQTSSLFCICIVLLRMSSVTCAQPVFLCSLPSLLRKEENAGNFQSAG